MSYTVRVFTSDDLSSWLPDQVFDTLEDAYQKIWGRGEHAEENEGRTIVWTGEQGGFRIYDEEGVCIDSNTVEGGGTQMALTNADPLKELVPHLMSGVPFGIAVQPNI